MNTALGIFFLLLSFFGILAICFFIYAIRWNQIEKQVRKALQAEFNLKNDQAFEQIAEYRKKVESECEKMLADLDAKVKEAEAMQEKNIQSGRIQAKQQILQTMNFVISSFYTSEQIKTKLISFTKKVQEQLQF